MKLRFGDLAGHTFGLVDGDDDGLRLRGATARDARVLGSEPVLVVDDEHDGVGLLDRELDLLGDERRDRRCCRRSRGRRCR